MTRLLQGRRIGGRRARGPVAITCKNVLAQVARTHRDSERPLDEPRHPMAEDGWLGRISYRASLRDVVGPLGSERGCTVHFMSSAITSTLMQRHVLEVPGVQVRYTPIEAAIRWSGLLEQESRILAAFQPPLSRAATTLREWPHLQLAFERIVDGIVHSELRTYIDDAPFNAASSLDHPRLTIRHIDLRHWMEIYYPECRPAFLFGNVEPTRTMLSSMTLIEAIEGEIWALRRLDDYQRQDLDSLRKRHVRKAKVPSLTGAAGGGLSPRAERTYMNILGGLMELTLGYAPSGKPYSVYRSQEAVIAALIEGADTRLGLSEATLEATLTAARRQLKD
jgi:hypothetical protein